jgi:cobalamin biosynthesis protein CbiG
MTLVLGVGAASTATTQEISALIATTLAQQGLSPQDVTAVATLDSKAPALAALCRERGWDLFTHGAEELDRQLVPTPNDRYPRSVAEAAAQLHGELVVAKTASAHATLAVARQR